MFRLRGLVWPQRIFKSVLDKTLSVYKKRNRRIRDFNGHILTITGPLPPRLRFRVACLGHPLAHHERVLPGISAQCRCLPASGLAKLRTRHREAKNVSVADLVSAATQQTAGCLRSHDGCQTIFLCES